MVLDAHEQLLPDDRHPVRALRGPRRGLRDAGGVWIRLLGALHGKSVYRITLQSRAGAFDLAVNVNASLPAIAGRSSGILESSLL